MHKADWLVDATWYKLANQLFPLASPWWLEGQIESAMRAQIWLVTLSDTTWYQVVSTDQSALRNDSTIVVGGTNRKYRL